MEFRIHQKINQDALPPQKLLPAVFPYSQCAVDGVKYSKHLQPLMPLPPKKKGKYDSDIVINHLKILPKRSAERAFAINAVAKSGDAKFGRTTIYETLKKEEANNAWVADNFNDRKKRH